MTGRWRYFRTGDLAAALAHADAGGVAVHDSGKKFMGKEYDGIHRQSFLIDEEGKIAHHFDKFKTSDHHQVVLDAFDEAQPAPGAADAEEGFRLVEGLDPRGKLPQRRTFAPHTRGAD